MFSFVWLSTEPLTSLFRSQPSVNTGFEVVEASVNNELDVEGAILMDGVAINRVNTESFAQSCACLSGMDSGIGIDRTADKDRSTSLADEPTSLAHDCEVNSLPISYQPCGTEDHRRESNEWLEATIERAEDCDPSEEQKQTLLINTQDSSAVKRFSSVGCNTLPRFRHYPSSPRCLTRDCTPMPSTTNMASIPKSLSTRWKERGDNALLAVISALYAKLLVVMGLAFPMTEVISNHVPSFSYLGFYLYLYFVSIVYFFFVFFTMLKNRAAKGNRYFGCGQMKQSRVLEFKEAADKYDEEHSSEGNPRIAGKMTSQHYGSFYLRIGAVAFGVGSMIYSGLEFAQYFETDPGSRCHNLLMAVTPAARMVFTFIQMYFIFLNAKMAVYCKPRAIAYFGLMHMVATNLCVWLNVIIEETKHEILHQFSHNQDLDNGKHLTSTREHSLTRKRNADPVGYLEPMDILHQNLEDIGSSSLGDECKRSDMMGNVVQDASQFLFPCAIEYSLICAAILYVMWKNVSMGEHETNYRRSNSGGSAAVRRSRHQYSVDCAKANKGLFAGIFVLVGTIISLILFFALINNPIYRTVAIMEVGVARLMLFCLAFVATLVGIFQIRELAFDSSRHFGLDAVLLVVAQIGLMAYKLFTVIACCYSVANDDDQDSALVLLSALAATFQAVAQTLFILDASRRHTYTVDQQSRKPGREVVTFLLMCNFAMWTVNTLEKSRADVNPLQLEFFGLWPWIIIMNVSMPLTIFYRFHSTVVLCEIWKRCYKVKPEFM